MCGGTCAASSVITESKSSITLTQVGPNSVHTDLLAEIGGIGIAFVVVYCVIKLNSSEDTYFFCQLTTACVPIAVQSVPSVAVTCIAPNSILTILVA